MDSLLLLGRQPHLGLMELESLYGASRLTPVGDRAVLVSVDPCVLAFSRLGGSSKFCKVLTSLPTTDWKKIESFLLKTAPEQSKLMPEGKMLLGLSAVGLSITKEKLQATALSLKKSIRKTGRGVRIIPNNALTLSSAQVIHNKLTGRHGWELVFVRDQEQTIIAQTVREQDIASYTQRDRERPMRDAKVGMLPPKLAQIIINLATGAIPASDMDAGCSDPSSSQTPIVTSKGILLDPFCGSGVILQEAALMGYSVHGTDVEPRMADYSKANLAWLQKRLPRPLESSVEVADATHHSWPRDITYVASESYLGRPFTSRPSPEMLSQTVADCNGIIKKFLLNWGKQTSRGSRLCIAVPAWQTNSGIFQHLPLIDRLTELGYNRVNFEYAKTDQMIYYRPEQFVARELLVLIRI